MNPKRIKEIIEMIPKECQPRLGGSCNLYFRGKKDSYRDVDIIINKSTIDKINLPFPKIELIHKVRLNKTIKYCIDGMEIDIIESMFDVNRMEKSIMGFYFEYEEDVINARNEIYEFIKTSNYVW